MDRHGTRRRSDRDVILLWAWAWGGSDDQRGAVPEIETTWADWNVEHECQCHTSFVLPFDLEYNDIGIFDMVCLFPILSQNTSVSFFSGHPVSLWSYWLPGIISTAVLCGNVREWKQRKPRSHSKVLNFAARIISNRQKYDHITDVLHKLEWLNARQFIEYFDLCMLYSMVSTGQPHLLASQFKFNRDVRERSTRQSNEIHLARPRTNHKKRTFVYPASALVNSYDIKNSNSLTSNSVHSRIQSTRGCFKQWAKSAVRKGKETS